MAKKAATRINANAALTPREGTEKAVQWVKISDLRLDPLNPRLPEGHEKSTHPELLKELAIEYELQDIGQSIADNGYFAEEPLVTIKNGSTWTVVEGNRRLAALLLLENPSSAPKASREKWDVLAKERKIIVKKVPILEYTDRNEIIPYLGFRHITGVLQWRLYQKARYISQLVEDASMSFTSIARIIGSKTPTVRDHYVAYTLLRQARDSFLIETEFAEESFGVLRRALSDPNIRKFIDLDVGRTEKQLARPVAKGNASAVTELLVWMFGTDEQDPVLKDSRQLKTLGEVLASTRATAVLRSSKDLEYAFGLSGGEERKLVESLNSASYHLDQALPLALRHGKDKGVLAAFDRCQRTFKEIARQLGG